MRSTRAVAVIIQAMSPDYARHEVSESLSGALDGSSKAYLVVNVDIVMKRITSGRDGVVVWYEDGVVEGSEVGSNTVRHLDRLDAQAKELKNEGCEVEDLSSRTSMCTVHNVLSERECG